MLLFMKRTKSQGNCVLHHFPILYNNVFYRRDFYLVSFTEKSPRVINWHESDSNCPGMYVKLILCLEQYEFPVGINTVESMNKQFRVIEGLLEVFIKVAGHSRSSLK